MMPAKMISEIPLPMPCSVICSPSHMTNMVPVVSVIIVVSVNRAGGKFGSTTPMLRSATLMPKDWTMARPRVPKRVYWLIFLRPSSPSFASFSK